MVVLPLMSRKILSLFAASLAMAAPAAAVPSEAVGVAAAVNRDALGTPPGQAVRTLTLGDNVIFNERIQTNSVGLLQILLADGTAFTVGPNSSLSIDSFVYDPNKGTAKIAATVGKGVFRFIGGKTSKTPDGVKIASPVGTIGVRGAIADISIRDGTGGYDADIGMAYGRDVTLTMKNGQRQRVYQGGYFISLRGSGSNQQQVSVTRGGSGFVSGIQQSLSGRPGTTGGAPTSPTDQTVEISGVSSANSSRSPVITNPPVPIPRPQSGPLETVAQDSTKDVVRTEVQGGSEPPPSPPPGTQRDIRMLTASTTYNTDDGPISNPGSVGLLGGSPGEDQRVTLSTRDGDTLASGDSSQGRLVLPIYSSGAFTAHTIGLSSGATLGGVALTGTGYSGEDGFLAYVLSKNGDRTKPLLALTGTPISDLSVLNNGDVRSYNFTPDMLQNIGAPFSREAGHAADYARAAITPFYIIEPTSAAQGNPRLLQSWLAITGEGIGQVSGVGVNVGEVSSNGGVLGINFGRRGSARDDTAEYPVGFFGGVASLSGPSGGNQLFGSKGQNLVLSTGSTINDYFSDRQGDSSPSIHFSTAHVLNLASETSLGTFLNDHNSQRSFATTSVMHGFSSSLQEEDSGNLLMMRGLSPSDLTIVFNGAENSFGAELITANPAGDSAYAVSAFAFGDGINGNTTGGSSAYIDDDTFAATRNWDRSRTIIQNYDNQGNLTDQWYERRSRSAGNYMVSGNAVKQSILPDGKLCECKFLAWGWWGTQIDAVRDRNSDSRDFRLSAHLGNWVAGDVSTGAQLATLAGTNARYQGNAIGTVVSTQGANSYRYIAAGQMQMDFDFSNRIGSMTLSNFDHRDFQGSVIAGTDGAVLGGLSQTGGVGTRADGNVTGAFVNDGATVAKGVIGSFSLDTPSYDWRAVGVLAGAR